MSEETQTLDHNTALHSLIEVGDEQDVQMILGHKDKLRCGGIIRTGVKVLKKDAKPNEIALFKELEAQGLPYDEIDRKLGGEPKTAKSKLFPKNADHFVIRDCDFTRPSDAQLIRSKYADKDGFVRSVPIWLSQGEIDRVLWHSFKSFNGSGSIVAASFYEGKDLMCRYLPKDFRGVAKKEDWLVAKLDSDNPVSPAGHKMQFGGILRFDIPGLRGFDEIFIPTRSYYGIGYSVALLRRVRMVLGRFDGLLNGESFLCITKSPEVVTDPKGNKVTQYIPVIELSCDPMELARYAEPQAVAARSATALSLLTGRRAEPEAAPEPVPAAAVILPAQDVPPADDFDRAKAIAAVVALVAPHGLTEQEIAIYAASQGMGEDLSTFDKAGMTNLYMHIRYCLKDDVEDFVEKVRDICQSPVSDDEPF